MLSTFTLKDFQSSFVQFIKEADHPEIVEAEGQVIVISMKRETVITRLTKLHGKNLPTHTPVLGVQQLGTFIDLWRKGLIIILDTPKE